MMYLLDSIRFKILTYILDLRVCLCVCPLIDFRLVNAPIEIELLQNFDLNLYIRIEILSYYIVKF